MQIDPIPALMLAFFIGAGLFYLILHRRYYPKETQLDSMDALNRRITGGKPTLLQFHAPL